MDNKKQPSADTSKTISEAFVKHQEFLKRFLSRFLSRPQDIEDVVQDTFLKAYAAEKKQTINHPKAFLFQVARNTALKTLTKKSNQITKFIEEIDDTEVNYEGISVEEQAMARQKLGIFCHSVLDMPPQCRRVFLMAKVYGLSHKEISAELGVSRSAVEKHVAKGLLICSQFIKRQSEPAENADNTSHSWQASKSTSLAEAINDGGLHLDNVAHLTASQKNYSKESQNDNEDTQRQTKHKNKARLQKQRDPL